MEKILFEYNHPFIGDHVNGIYCIIGEHSIEAIYAPVISKTNTNIILHESELEYPDHDELPISLVLEIMGEKVCFIGDLPCEVQKYDIRNSLGKVFLVGAGQSSGDQLTIKANQILHNADIVFYDSLIDKSILNDINAELVFVGKRAGTHYKSQHDINKLLLDATKKHKKVVRIKGGDPMIFGHAGEEIAFLEQNFISVEVIPGITSALGGAAIANTPLTLRNVSNSVSFCTAHQKSQIPVPNTDTIVYFMGAGNMRNVAKQLLNAGKEKSLPVKLIYNIGASDQEIHSETIDSLINSGKTYKAPLLSIVGDVTDKKNWLSAFNYKPKILFTGTNISKYIKLGYVIHHPMIELAELEEFTEVDNVIKNIEQYNWLLFTSIYAVKFFFKRLNELCLDTRTLSSINIASIGRFTSKRLKEYGIIPDLQAKDESSEGLIYRFAEKRINNASIVIPRSNLAHNTLPEGLKQLGNTVNPLVVYNNVQPNIEKKVDPESYDQVIFTSPSGVANFMNVYGKLPSLPKLIAKGKETQKEIDKYL